jgi:uncharacterized membrane protein YfcA
MGDLIKNSGATILSLFSIIVFISGIIALLYYTEHGAITKKGLWIVSICSFFSILLFTGVLIITDPENIFGAIFVLCVSSIFVAALFVVHFVGITNYNKQHAKGKNMKEVDEILKKLFPFKK